jgi:F420-dependent oxidoreductase-like protein
VLVGTSGAGKTTWADRAFRPGQVVSSDRLRGMVGEDEFDQRAGADAFAVLDLVVDRRLKRGLVTVIDSLALDTKRRQGYVALARQHGVPAHAVVFDTTPDVCRARIKARGMPQVPAKVFTKQLADLEQVRAAIVDEGFDGVHAPDDDVRFVTPDALNAPGAAARQREEPMTLTFGLQIPNFTWSGGPEQLGANLAAIGRAADEAGFESVWVMDHFLQIPQVGREWQEMLDSYTALGFLAAATERVKLGTLVTGVTYRNVAHLAKIVATLDVLSGGRAICGLGAAWFEREHLAYGWDFPPLGERFALLEDALQLLPLMWGPGSPAFDGKMVKVPEAMCYPRPLQERVPILVGGSGEQRTLRLVAQYADACNLFGDAAVIAHKVDVLRRHCAAVDRDPAEITVTQLSRVVSAADADALAATLDRMRPARANPETFAASVGAATLDEHIGRFRGLAEAGLHTAIVNMPDLDGTAPIERFAEVIAAFR